MSTGKQHPLAAVPTLFLRQSPIITMVSHNIQIFGDLISLLILNQTDLGNELVIWNWKTGAQLMVRHLRNSTLPGSQAFCMQNICGIDIMSATVISDDWVVLCIIITQIEDEYEPALTAINFSIEGPERRPFSAVKHRIIYPYPKFLDLSFIERIDIRAEATPSSLCDTSPASTPFIYNNDDFVLVVTVIFATEELADPLTTIHFLSRNYLLELSAAVLLPAESTPHVCDWHIWGQGPGSRLILTANVPSSIWVCYVFGNKFVLPDPDPAPNTDAGISAYLFDFYKTASRIDAEDPINLPEKGVIGDQDSINDLFGEKLDTPMPYRSSEVHFTDAHMHSNILCSQDNIILVDVSIHCHRSEAGVTDTDFRTARAQVLPSLGILVECRSSANKKINWWQNTLQTNSPMAYLSLGSPQRRNNEKRSKARMKAKKRTRGYGHKPSN